jgi:VIT1/CCC1 family predicted Fe2+/Mn2+ transporter
MVRDETRQYLKNWQGEMDGAEIYSRMAAIEKDEKIAGLYGRLAETERKHAVRWQEKLQALQVSVPSYRPSWQTRVLRWLILHVGPDLVLPTLHSQEQRTSKDYRKQQAGDDMAADERSHAILLQQLVQTSKGMEGSTLARIEGRHRGAGGNALRAAVLGASDGLISNYNLIMGVAGAAMSSSNILLTGLAGLLAGSISMAMGEWISVQSSRELFEKQLATEKEEIETAPEEEIDELVLIYQARGLSESMARTMATQIMSDKEHALETLAREELGIDPAELGGSAWEAAIASFLFFALGAVIPVLPYFFLEGTPATVTSAVFGAAGLFLIGVAITLFTGQSAVRSGLRQTLFGVVSALVTFGVGHLIGVSIS